MTKEVAFLQRLSQHTIVFGGTTLSVKERINTHELEDFLEFLEALTMEAPISWDSLWQALQAAFSWSEGETAVLWRRAKKKGAIKTVYMKGKGLYYWHKYNYELNGSPYGV